MNLLDYIRGIKKGKNAHLIEKKAMEDPFLSEALEGFASTEGDHFFKIKSIQNKITKHSKKRINKNRIIAVAAGFLLCIGIGSFFLSRENMSSHDDLLSKVSVDEINIYIPEKEQKEPEIEIQKEKTIPIRRQYSKASEKPKPVEIVKEMVEIQKNADSDLTAEYINSDTNVFDVSSISLEKNENNDIAFLQGRVVDNSGEPLIGASIQQKKSGMGTITDVHGNFMLDKAQLNLDEPLTIEYLGFDSKELLIKPTDTMLIALNESADLLDEVVVIAYGSSKRSEVLGRVSSAQTIGKNKKPEPVDGMKKYKKYIKENINKSDVNSCNNIKGKVILLFFINDSGRPYNIRVKKSLCNELDIEAIRLVNEGPDWTVGSSEIEFTVDF